MWSTFLTEDRNIGIMLDQCLYWWVAYGSGYHSWSAEVFFEPSSSCSLNINWCNFFFLFFEHQLVCSFNLLLLWSSTRVRVTTQCNHSVCKVDDKIAPSFLMIDCIREMTAKKSCKYGEYGSCEDQLLLFSFLFTPRKRKQQQQQNHGFVLQLDAGWEEYYDYIFPDEAAAQPNLKLLALAKMWKKDVDRNDDDDDDEDDDEEEDEDEEEEEAGPSTGRENDKRMDTGKDKEMDVDEDSGVSDSDEGDKSWTMGNKHLCVCGEGGRGRCRGVYADQGGHRQTCLHVKQNTWVWRGGGGRVCWPVWTQTCLHVKQNTWLEWGGWGGGGGGGSILTNVDTDLFTCEVKLLGVGVHWQIWILLHICSEALVCVCQREREWLRECLELSGHRHEWLCVNVLRSAYVIENLHCPWLIGVLAHEMCSLKKRKDRERKIWSTIKRLELAIGEHG